MSTSTDTNSSIASDAPITHPDADVLHRSEFAKHLADAILTVPANDGFVLGLNGPWGSGKTSVINLVKHHLAQQCKDKNVIITEFKPWWFSGQEQLITQYFRHLWTEFKKPDVPDTLSQIGDAFECMGNIFDRLSSVPNVPGSSDWISKIFQAFAFAFSSSARSRQQSLDQWRDKVIKQLKQQKARLVVVIDDIDRLTAEEMRQMFQVVKAAANFPNTIYLLSFDTTVVELALENVQAGSGRDYLEKIVQMPFDIPQPDGPTLHRFFTTQLDQILQETPDDLWMRDEWSTLFWDCIAPYLISLRDVKRLINRLRSSYPLVRGEVNATEFIVLQTLYLFEPTLIEYVKDNWKDFAESDSLMGRDRITEDARRAKVNELLDSMRISNRKAAETGLDKLFPRWKGGGTDDGYTLHKWREKRLIRHPEITRRYFMLQVPAGDVSDATIREILNSAKDPVVFGDQLRKLTTEKTPDGVTRVHVFLEKLQDYTESRIPEEDIEPILRAIFKVGDELFIETDRSGFFSSGNDMLLLRVVYQLTKRYRTQEARYQVLSTAIRPGTALSTIIHEVAVRGQEHGKFSNRDRLDPEDQRTISGLHLAQLEAIALEKIRAAASAGTFHKHPRLAGNLYSWKEWARVDEPRSYAKQLVTTDEGFVELMVGCAGRSSSSGSGGYREWWSISLDTIIEFTELEEDYVLKHTRDLIESRPPWMSERQREILNSFLENYERPRRRTLNIEDDDNS